MAEQKISWLERTIGKNVTVYTEIPGYNRIVGDLIDVNTKPDYIVVRTGNIPGCYINEMVPFTLIKLVECTH
jgi:hypothetical protein